MFSVQEQTCYTGLIIIIIMIMIMIINTDNWTEWSAIRSEIIRVISKTERARNASSIWNHKYDFRPKLHDMKFNYHSIISLLPAIWFVTLKWKDLKSVWFCCFVLIFHWLGKRCNLEQKMVWFGNKSYCWQPIRSYGSPLISKWMRVMIKRNTDTISITLSP